MGQHDIHMQVVVVPELKSLLCGTLTAKSFLFMAHFCN